MTQFIDSHLAAFEHHNNYNIIKLNDADVGPHFDSLYVRTCDKSYHIDNSACIALHANLTSDNFKQLIVTKVCHNEHDILSSFQKIHDLQKHITRHKRCVETNNVCLSTSIFNYNFEYDTFTEKVVVFFILEDSNTAKTLEQMLDSVSSQNYCFFNHDQHKYCKTVL